jgi:hypothetical protein
VCTVYLYRRIWIFLLFCVMHLTVLLCFFNVSFFLSQLCNMGGTCNVSISSSIHFEDGMRLLGYCFDENGNVNNQRWSQLFSPC